MNDAELLDRMATELRLARAGLPAYSSTYTRSQEILAEYDRLRASPDVVVKKEHCVFLRAVIANGGNEAAIGLAAQLDGVPPCPDCDYVIQHCRCTNTASAIAPVKTGEI